MIKEILIELKSIKGHNSALVAANFVLFPQVLLKVLIITGRSDKGGDVAAGNGHDINRPTESA